MVLEEFGTKMGDRASKILGRNPDGTKISQVGERPRSGVIEQKDEKSKPKLISKERHVSDLFLGLGGVIIGGFLFFSFLWYAGVLFFIAGLIAIWCFIEGR